MEKRWRVSFDGAVWVVICVCLTVAKIRLNAQSRQAGSLVQGEFQMHITVKTIPFRTAVVGGCSDFGWLGTARLTCEQHHGTIAVCVKKLTTQMPIMPNVSVLLFVSGLPKFFPAKKLNQSHFLTNSAIISTVLKLYFMN